MTPGAEKRASKPFLGAGFPRVHEAVNTDTTRAEGE